MSVLRRSHCALAALFAFAAAACASPAGGTTTDNDFTSAETTAPAAPSACADGTFFDPPGFEEELTTLSASKKAHDPAGYVLATDVPDGPELVVAVAALGSGEHAGNFQHVALEAWEVCGRELRIAPKARIQFSGEGLTEAERALCAADLSQPVCATLAHYCVPGTVKAPLHTIGGCELKAGIDVEVGFYRRAAPTAR